MTRADNSSFTSALANQLSSWALSHGPKAQAVVVSTGHAPEQVLGSRGGKKRRVAGKGNHLVCRSGQPQAQARLPGCHLAWLLTVSTARERKLRPRKRILLVSRTLAICLQHLSILVEDHLPQILHPSTQQSASPLLHPTTCPPGACGCRGRVVLGQSRESIVKQTCPQN